MKKTILLLILAISILGCEKREKLKIAFCRYTPPTYGMKIWVMDEDGKNQKMVSGEEDGIEPKWSPCGNYIIFSYHRISLKEGTVTEFVYGLNPCYSPDGKKVAFFAFQNESRNRKKDGIYIKDLETEKETFLTEGRRPAWSPDGERIAFEDDREGDLEVYVIDVDGKNLKNISNNTSGDDEFPSWSPDGKWIVYVSHTHPPPEANLWIADSEDKTKRKLTNFKRGDKIVGPESPSWSPMGDKIAFQAIDWREWDRIALAIGKKKKGEIFIFTIKPDGTGLKRIAQGQCPSFSPLPKEVMPKGE
jgi:TolB protein